MRILFIYPEGLERTENVLLRCMIPAKLIQRSGVHQAEILDSWSFGHNSPEVTRACQSADVIVIHRNLYGKALQAVQRWKARGKCVIFDLASPYFSIAESSDQYAYWREGNPSRVEQLVWGMKLVDAVTASSQRLADDWGNLVNSYYLPNFLDSDHFEVVSPESRTGFVVGWNAEDTTWTALVKSGFLEALERVGKVYPDLSVLVANGDAVQYIDEIPLPAERKAIISGKTEEAPRFLSKIDFGVAPLWGDYDDRKPWNRALEFMLMRVPWAASEGPAYMELAPYGTLTANTVAAWEKALREAYIGWATPVHRDQTVNNGYLFALSQVIDENVGKIIQMYAMIRESAHQGREVQHAVRYARA